jgi:hypothetical protein
VCWPLTSSRNQTEILQRLRNDYMQGRRRHQVIGPLLGVNERDLATREISAYEIGGLLVQVVTKQELPLTKIPPNQPGSSVGVDQIENAPSVPSCLSQSGASLFAINPCKRTPLIKNSRQSRLGVRVINAVERLGGVEDFWFRERDRKRFVIIV